MKKVRKQISVLLTLIMAVAGIQMLPQSHITTKATSTTVSLVRNPRINQGANSDITVWDCIYFGNYWQNDTNGNGTADQNDDKEPIKWRVLSVDGNDAFVVADKGLDAHRFDASSNVWSISEIRTWLNGTFYNDAFDADEKNAIIETYNKTYDYDSDIGNVSTTSYTTTTDNVFLLSFGEATNSDYGFDTVKNNGDCRRYMHPTDYAIHNGAFQFTAMPDLDYYGCSSWWTRSPGDITPYVTYVFRPNVQGIVGFAQVQTANSADRPALHVNLSSPSVRYAGVVQCHGDALETATEEPTAGSGNAININGTAAESVATGETYTMPTSGDNYCSLGYIDEDNPENIYKPGDSITVTGEVNLITVDRLTVASNTSGARIKMDTSEPGLSFGATASFDGESPLLADSLTYGMLITTNDYYTEQYNSELTLESESEHGGKVHNVTFGEGEWISESDGTFAAGILNISDSNLSRSFISRAYIQVTYTDDTTAVIYSVNTSQARSVKQTAQNIQNNTTYYGTLSPSEKAAVDQFASVS